MRRRILFLIFLPLIVCCVKSQTVSCFPVFQKVYHGEGDDEPSDILSLPSGGMVVVGKTTSGSEGDYDGFIMKLDDEGKIVWSKTIGGVKFDEFLRIKQTSDNNYVVLGSTASFVNSHGQPWVLKIDNSGNVLWNKNFTLNSISQEIPDEITPLSDGSLAFTFNVDYKTSTGNGILVKLKSSGLIDWAKEFDNGNEDALTSLSAYKDTILLGAYATLNYRQGIFSKISVSNGTVFSSMQFPSEKGIHTEPVSIDGVSEGYAISLCRYYKNPEYYAPYLVLARVSFDGNMFYSRKPSLTGTLHTSVNDIRVKPTVDQGFAYLYRDSTPELSGEFIKFSPQGFVEWGKEFGNGYYSPWTRMTAFDIYSNGYVFAGYDSNFYTQKKSQIRIFKTDKRGNTGSCSELDHGDFYDTAKLKNVEFHWKNVGTIANLQSSDVNSRVTVSDFLEETSCESEVCDTTYNLGNACKPTFHETVKSNLSPYTYDVQETNDGGYVIAGAYAEFFDLTPLITKLTPSGEVSWMKSIAAYYHEGVLTNIKNTKDGNLLIMGLDDYEEDHGSTESLLIIKMSPSGQIIWSKIFLQYFTSGLDFTELPNGDILIFCHDDSYRNILFRLDEKGNILWKKDINTFTTPSSAKMYFKNNDLYIVFGAPNGTAYGTQIIKLNSSDGNVYWSKELFEDKESLNPLTITSIGDTICVVAMDRGLKYTYPQQSRIAVLKLSPEGAFYSATEISNISVVEGSLFGYNNIEPHYTERTIDDNFVMSQQVYINNVPVFNITKFTPDCKILWSKNYPALSNYYPWTVKIEGNNVIVAGQKLLDINNYRYKTQAFVIKTDEEGNIIPGETNGICAATDYVGLTSVSYTPSFIDISFSNTTDNENLSASEYKPFYRPLTANAVPYCSTQTNCTTFSLEGVDTLCQDNSNYLVKLKRNNGCTASAIWLKNENYNILNYSDTSATIQFKNKGQVSINAQVNAGCALQTLSKTVYIPAIANKLNLGSDTILCANNQVVLHAGTEYRSYKWQDNSTDSILIVQQPGVYSVEVIDVCGNRFSDTIRITDAGNFNFSVGNDSIICKGDSLYVHASEGFIDYQWKPAYDLEIVTPASAILYPDTTTSYIITAQKWSGCFVIDTLTLFVNSPIPFSLGADTAFCKGTLLTLRAPSSFTGYLWSDGSNATTYNVSATGSYYLQAKDINGCNASDTINITVNENPSISLGPDKNICTGQTVTLALTQSSTNITLYNWQDGSQQPQLTTSQLGTYYVQVWNKDQCSSTDTIHLLAYNPLPSGFLIPYDSLCENESMQLTATGIFTAYNWSTGAVTSTATINTSGIYTLTVTDQNGCIGTDSTTIYSKQCLYGLFFPSGFSPNNDGKNDLYKPVVKSSLEKYHFIIFNRFGQKVFETSDPQKGWNGYFNGIPQPGNSVYVWSCQYQVQGQPLQNKKGTVTLLR